MLASAIYNHMQHVINGRNKHICAALYCLYCCATTYALSVSVLPDFKCLFLLTSQQLLSRTDAAKVVSSVTNKGRF